LRHDQSGQDSSSCAYYDRSAALVHWDAVHVVVGRSRRQFILHPILLGAHGDRLNIHSVLKSLQSPRLRRMYMHSRICCGCLSAAARHAGAASTGNHVFDRVAADHRGIKANLDDVFRPVKMDAGDVRLGTERSLDRICAFRAVDILQLKYHVLLTMSRWMGHHSPRFPQAGGSRSCLG